MKDVVTCQSRFEDPMDDDKQRQRNLQHSIRLEDLLPEEKTISLTTGNHFAKFWISEK